MSFLKKMSDIAKIITEATDTVKQPETTTEQPKPKNTRKKTVRNYKGQKVSTDAVKEIDLLEHELVESLFDSVTDLNSYMLETKTAMDSKIEQHIKIIHEKYGAKVGNENGSFSLNNHDKFKKIRVQVQNHSVFNSKIEVVKTLLRDYEYELTTEIENSNLSEEIALDLKQTVSDAFDFLSEAKVSPAKLAGLKQKNIKHPKWNQAMNALNDAIDPAGKKRYLTFLKRENIGEKMRQLLLNFSSI